MTIPTLHVPQKDSPQSALAAGINDTETVLTLDDSSIFEADNITRLTIGIDQSATEVITISSYNGNNEITVVRGTPAYSWPLGTLVARVLNADDITEIHQYLEDLHTTLSDGSTVTNGDSHDHSGGDGAVIPEGGIATGAVTADKIGTGAVTADKIGTGAVTSSKLVSDAVDGSKIADNSINSEHIYSGAIDTIHIANEQITALKLATSSVIEEKIATGAVTENKIGTGAVTENKIGTGAVTENKIGTGAVSELKLSFDLPKLVEGRLTLTSGNPDILTDQAGITVYYTPYCGDTIALYDGSSKWELITFTELSLATDVLDALSVYDVFCYNNSGTAALEVTKWTNTTTRATALVRQNGVYVKNGATTRRYLGTFFTHSDNNVYDHYQYRYLWNHYNKLFKPLYVYSGSDNYCNFVVGDPNGVNLKWSIGGSVNNSQMMYSYSTVDPDGAPGHGEYGKQDTNSSIHGSSQTIMTKFSAGYGYIRQTPSGGTVAYGRMIGELWC
jgi:hypothetical protein